MFIISPQLTIYYIQSSLAWLHSTIGIRISFEVLGQLKGASIHSHCICTLGNQAKKEGTGEK